MFHGITFRLIIVGPTAKFRIKESVGEPIKANFKI